MASTFSFYQARQSLKKTERGHIRETLCYGVLPGAIFGVAARIKVVAGGISEHDAGEFHDQADAKWIVIRGPLRGHNDMPRPAYRLPRGWPPLGCIWWFYLLWISDIIFRIICLIMELTCSIKWEPDAVSTRSKESKWRRFRVHRVAFPYCCDGISRRLHPLEGTVGQSFRTKRRREINL
jgi:hypothetical protein